MKKGRDRGLKKIDELKISWEENKKDCWETERVGSKGDRERED